MTYIVLVTLLFFFVCFPPTQLLNGDVPLKFGPNTFLLNALHYLYETSSKPFLKCSKFNLHFYHTNIPHPSKCDLIDPLLRPKTKYFSWISSFPSFLNFDLLSPVDSTTKIYLSPSKSFQPHLPPPYHKCLKNSLSTSIQVISK